MKKKNLKNLGLKKMVVSRLNSQTANELLGGATRAGGTCEIMGPSDGSPCWICTR